MKVFTSGSNSKMDEMPIVFGMKNIKHKRNNDLKSFHLGVFDRLIGGMCRHI